MNKVMIVGGGIAGLSAAIYTAGAGLPTTVFDTGKSQIKQVGKIMNYPGIPEGISGVHLLDQLQIQCRNLGVEIIEQAIVDLHREGDSFTLSSETESYTAYYVVLAANLNRDILDKLRMDTIVNAFVPSGKIKSVVGTGFEGESGIENLYLAGLHAHIPSQAAVVAGQGAYIGIKIASDALQKAYMWHDN